MSRARDLANVADDVSTGTVVTTASPSLGRRNLIINGAMQVAQRGTSFTGLTNGSGGYKLDRWAWYENDAPSYVMTVSQSTDAPDNFKNSLKVETTTAEATLATGDLCRLRYSLEGQDMTQFGWGTSSAKQVTLSFWVKSNKTGTYVWYWNHYAGTSQTTSKTFTVDSSGVWEYKTITFAASGTAPSVTNNTLGSYLELIFVGGTTFTSGTANLDWADTNSNNRAAGLDVNLADTVGNYLAITGVQLEVGSVATPFEHRSFGEELALCQRYYEHTYDYGTAQGASATVGMMRFHGSTNAGGDMIFPVSFKQVKRATPTMKGYMTDGTADQWYRTRNGVSAAQSVSFYYTGTNGVCIGSSVGGAWVEANFYGHWYADAEL